ncbi:hypothetical protein [Algibacter sp. 2305UL17-15]|uniref:hypothetical protein n=1 Tax=Algibacter sp. 2305UL17-15 TaxID=3231268 RepID=UPI0034587C98
MGEQRVSIVMALIFMAFVTAPTVITVIDDSIDISMFYAITEEEEKGSENGKSLNLICFEDIFNEDNLTLNASENSLRYFFKTYPIPHLNLISPPPDYI